MLMAIKFKPMIQQIFPLILLCLCLGLPSVSLSSTFDDSEIRHIDYPNWFLESPFFDLAEDLNNTRKKGKKGLMILFTTQGCSYCDAFIQKSLGNPDIAKEVQRNFDSVGMEIFDDTEMITPEGASMSIKQFSQKENVQFSPTLLFYGENGKRIVRLTGYQSPERFKLIIDYVANEHYRTLSLRNYMTKVKSRTPSTQSKKELKADVLFEKPPYMLDRSRFSASQPLLVIFEEIDCTDCDDFHSSVLALKEVRSTLKNFEIVRFDASDNKTKVLAPDGRKITPAKWYEESNLSRTPAMIFFDRNGNEVLKTGTLVLRQRMMNSLNYVLEQAYKKGWSYQQFARSKAIERLQKKQQ
jgi:thioredoxin-related protein